jgi:hypothetical protein
MSAEDHVMHELLPPPSPTRRRRLLLAGLCIPALLVLPPIFLLFFYPDIRLRQVLAETDRLDPGWRLDELEAGRAAVPDAENAAVSLTAALKLMPSGWPFWENPQASVNAERDPDECAALKQGFWSPGTPTLRLDARQTKALREEVQRAAATLAEARKAADRPHGRFRIVYSPDFRSLVVTDAVVAVRQAISLLGYDALLRAEENDPDGALTSCRAMFSAARAIGDEPTPHSVMARMFAHLNGLQKTERVLAQGEPSEPALAALQQLVEAEAAEPLLVIAARGERASLDGVMQALERGEMKVNQCWSLLELGANSTSDWEQIAMQLDSPKRNRAALLQFMNEVVEAAKRPPTEQRQEMDRLRASQKRLPPLARNVGIQTFKAYGLSLLDLASLRSAMVLLAAERYRRAHGRWPTAAAELVPAYLKAVPVDPYDGASIRLRPSPDGVIVYSVGEDRQDNGGNLSGTFKAGTDWGYRLWDVSRRRQPPAASAP